MSSKTRNIKSIEDLSLWITQYFLPQLSTTQKDVVLLNGPMGVGKTQWVKLFVNKLLDNRQTHEAVTSSPTFSLQNTYKTPDILIHHFDLYRLGVEKDLESFNFWDVFKEDRACIVIEWSNKFAVLDFFPGWTVHNINLSFKKEESSSLRLIEYYK